MISVSRFARVAVRWGMTTKIACAVLLFIGCNSKVHVLTSADAGPDAGPAADAGAPPDAGASPDAGAPPDAGPPDTGGCWATDSYGSLLHSIPSMAGYNGSDPLEYNGADLYEGCDGAPIILHGQGLPHYPAGLAEEFRDGMDYPGDPTPITFGPCCPSVGAASGTCVVWPMSAYERTRFEEGDYDTAVGLMRLHGASVDPMHAPGSYPYCMPVRRP